MGKPPASRLIDKLPAALDVPVDMIKQAVEESRQYLRESEEAAWRAAHQVDELGRRQRVTSKPRTFFYLGKTKLEIGNVPLTAKF